MIEISDPLTFEEFLRVRDAVSRAEGQYRPVMTSLDTATSVHVPTVSFDVSHLFAPISPSRP